MAGTPWDFSVIPSTITEVTVTDGTTTVTATKNLLDKFSVTDFVETTTVTISATGYTSKSVTVGTSTVDLTNYVSNITKGSINYVLKDSNAAGWAMPSSSYEDITVGASGASYTAPANGYYYFVTTNTASADNYTYLINETTGVAFYAMANAAIVARGFVPVKKGQQVTLGYFSSIIAAFRFVYAEGSKSEAN